MNLSRREEAHQPTLQEARSRQTAMEAERHWWVTRLRALVGEADDGWLDRETDDLAWWFDKLDALIAERTS